MAKIEVGMMVEIIGDLYDPEFIGHIGKVLRKSVVYSNNWIIDGAEFAPNGGLQSYADYHLRPINPPKTNQDIEETKAKGCGD